MGGDFVVTQRFINLLAAGVHLKFSFIQLNQGVGFPRFCLAACKYWILTVFVVLLAGVTVRMPQTTYVVNNGLALGSGAPQLTVHHRPPQAHTVSGAFQSPNAMYCLVSARCSYCELQNSEMPSWHFSASSHTWHHQSPTATPAQNENGKSCAIC